jgi:hypothetical protein
MLPKTLRLLGCATLLATAPLFREPTQAQAQTQKPNILIIWGDDIGVSNVSA